MNILQGGSVIGGSGAMGWSAGTSGVVTVEGTWTNSSSMTLGIYGSGTLNIRPGGTVTNGMSYLGANYTGSSGNVTVGGTWTTTGIQLGNSSTHGTGTLDIEPGGMVTSIQTWGQHGYITVGGTFDSGNSFEMHKDFVLDILPGGQITDLLGTVYGGSTNIGGTWTNTGQLVVGYNSEEALMTIASGGSVSNTDGYVGQQAAIGDVTVAGTWTNDGILFVGYNGYGTLTIEHGGSVRSISSLIGEGYNATSANGIVIVAGTWTNSESISVGSGGAGVLTIQSGGQVSNGLGTISQTGTANVAGAWSNTGFLDIRGILSIESGGQVSNDLGTISQTGTANVAGAWSNTGFLDIRGILSIESGGQVSNVDGLINSGGQVNVIGIWENSGDLHVGGSSVCMGNGTLTVASGGQVSNTDGLIGQRAGTFSQASISGVWINSGSLMVGGYGNGTLTVASGGSVSNTDGYLGFASGSTGQATISGTWTNDGTLYIGLVGSGVLNIDGGGTVTAENLILGNFSSLNINGGLLSVSGDMYTGDTISFRSGVIDIGGTLSDFDTVLGSSCILTVGEIGSGNTIRLDGGTIGVAGDFYGEDIQKLRLISSGTLVVGGDLLGETRIDRGLTLRMNGGQLPSSSSLMLNGGTLDGTLDVEGLVDVVVSSDSRGNLNIGLDGQLRVGLGQAMRVFSNEESVNAGRIDADGSQLQFNGHLANSGKINVSGRLALYGGWSSNGHINIVGDTTVYGDGDIIGGTVIIADGSAVNVMDDMVNNAAMFYVSGNAEVTFFGNVSGAGSFAGDGGVCFAGSYSPGNSLGDVTLDNVTCMAGNVLIMELTGTTLCGEYDHITVTNSTSLNGTLDVVLLDEFQPQNGDTFDLFDWDGLLTGCFSSINLPPLFGLAWDISALYTTGELGVTLKPFTLLGDANHDGVVSAGDYASVQANFGSTGDPGIPGDANGDGVVSAGDYASVQANFGNVAGSSEAVPEPVTLSTLVLGGIVMFGCKRQFLSKGKKR